MKEIDQIRTGEELNTENLAEYLRSRLPTAFDRIDVLQFTAGSSNLTYLIRLGSHEFVLRRPPFGNTVKTAHDMRREYAVLSRLAKIYKAAPETILFSDDTSVIGAEFYLMERRKGLIIRGGISDDDYSENSGFSEPQRKAIFQANYDLERSQDFRHSVCNAFIKNLAKLHKIDYNFAGLGDLGKPEGYPQRQIEGWTKRYFDAKTDELPMLEAVIKWLNENIPSESGAALIHNDYKFDNIMLHPKDLTRVVAVLDWEMVTIGDPLMDLGTTLGYWMSADAGEEMLSMPFNPRLLMENITRRYLVQMYEAATGKGVNNILFYYIFGTFKIAVIAQQIYARFVKGHTQDRRFATYGKFVERLGQIAHSALEKQSI